VSWTFYDSSGRIQTLGSGGGGNGAPWTFYDASGRVQTLGAGGSGAPTTVDYLVGTASGDLSAEIVVGTSPGGELGGTWASPTVDATHSGSTHSAATDTHEVAADPHTGYQKESEKNALSGYPGLSAAGFIAPGQIASTPLTDTMPMVQADGTLAYVTPSGTTQTVGNASFGGTADDWSRGDHTHALHGLGASAGQIMVRGSGLWSALAAPTTGQVLQGDTAETLKMKWVADPLTAHLADATDAHDASAVSILDSANDFTATDVEGALAELQSDNEAHVAATDPHPGYQPEREFPINSYRVPRGGRIQTRSLTADTEYAMVIDVPSGITIDRIAVYVSTAGGAATVIRLGIRNDDAAGLPGTLLVDAGTVAGDSVGNKVITGLSAVTTSGRVWVTSTSQTVTAPAPIIFGLEASGDIDIPDPNMSALRTALLRTGVSGALPATAFPSGLAVSIGPHIGIRRSA
jgi:hypothetical protein